ncbi:hypothetical protein P3342_001644 [Pyrenophora teres f. teres]|nr:hypothetical protein P3342_001644 [Pyrenophora teres f. teres]
MAEVVEISSAEETSSDDESDDEEEPPVAHTVTRKVTKNVTKNVTKTPTHEDLIMIALPKLQEQNKRLSDRLDVVRETQELATPFIDIETIDITEHSPPKKAQKRRMAVQPKKASIQPSNGFKKQKE